MTTDTTAAQLLTLRGSRSSISLEVVPGGLPLWRHWGGDLGVAPAAGPSLLALRPLPSFTLDAHWPLTLFPTFGLGWFAQSALLAHRDGRDAAQGFTHCEVQWLEPGRSLRIEARDDVAAVGVLLQLTLDANDVLSIDTTLHNHGAEPLSLQWLAAATLPLPATACRVRHYSGRHNHEFTECEDRLGRGQWRRENRRGLTSHDALPLAVVGTEGTTQHAGACWGAQLAWSGNSTQTLEWLDDGRYQWQLGEWLAPGELTLAPGGSLAAPTVLATWSDAGFDGVAANFHAAARQRLQWPGGRMSPRPVHLNTWEGFYFDHDETALRELADVAAQVGIERFVLDDGWFHRRDDDRRALGDWWPDARKYPQGLAPLAQYVIDRGMQFGLWVEPEMVNPDSELFRAHPDWALQLAGRALLTARNQLVLDLSRSDVRDYLFERLDGLLRDLPIAYLKWDHNRDLAPAGNAQGRISHHAQVQGAYALFARLREAHPDVEIESCAGGGGRIDTGILPWVHRFWTSDCIDAVYRVGAQRGFLQFLPPEVMGAHIGASPAHSTGRSQTLDFRAAVALTGHLGVELDVRKMDAAQRSRLAQWLALYKSMRHLQGRGCWRGEAGDSVNWTAIGDGNEALLCLYRLQPTTWRYPPLVTLPFLEADAQYRLQRIDPPPVDVHGHGNTAQPVHAAPWDAPLQVDGRWLREAGLVSPALHAECAALFRITRC